MWVVNGLNLVMAEGDYGVSLPAELHGAELSAQDSIKLTIKYRKNGEVKVDKICPIIDNYIDIKLTENESNSLPVGVYVYCLDWYQDGVFMCNVVLDAEFRVVDKA